MASARGMGRILKYGHARRVPAALTAEGEARESGRDNKGDQSTPVTKKQAGPPCNRFNGRRSKIGNKFCSAFELDFTRSSSSGDR